jgi:hypothetical protein
VVVAVFALAVFLWPSTNPISVDFRIVGQPLDAKNQIAAESDVVGGQGHRRKGTGFTRDNKQ